MTRQRKSNRLLAVIVIVLGGCRAASGARTVEATVDATVDAKPLPSPGERPSCRAERLAILDAVAASQALACTADTDCATTTNPGSVVHEFDVVVSAADRDAIAARSLAHIERCGSFLYYEPIDAIRIVEAACASGRCAEKETVLHVEE
jgi:hypothetical protein